MTYAFAGRTSLQRKMWWRISYQEGEQFAPPPPCCLTQSVIGSLCPQPIDVVVGSGTGGHLARYTAHTDVVKWYDVQTNVLDNIYELADKVVWFHVDTYASKILLPAL